MSAERTTENPQRLPVVYALYDASYPEDQMYECVLRLRAADGSVASVSTTWGELRRLRECLDELAQRGLL